MDEAKKFAEKTKVSEKTATRVLSLLYDKGLDATTFSRLLRRIESFVIKTKLPEMIDKLNDQQINSLIDEIIIDDQALNSEKEISCSENLGLWLFSEFAENTKTYSAGDEVEIQIMRTGTRNHPSYGKIEIDSKTLSEVKKNFDNGERKIDLAVDENHEPNHKALAWFRELYLKENKSSLFAKLELTQKGADLLNEGAYKYFSPEIIFKKQDEETGKIVSNLLIGGAFTNRPFFKAMTPLLASEEGGEVANNHQAKNGSKESDLLIFNNSKPMKKILELLAQFSEKKVISASEKADLEACFNALSEEDKTAEMTNAFNEVIAKFSDETADGEGDDTSDDNKKTTEGDDANNDGNGDADQGNGEGSDASGSVQANEDGTITMKASEFEALKSKAAETSKLIREARKNAANAKVASMKFSEGNAVGIILPKHSQMIVDFALSLSEKQEEKFFSIIQNLQTVAAGEIGHDKSTESHNFSAEEIAFFTEKFGMTNEEAIASLKSAKEQSGK